MQEKISLSVVILAKNEEKNIEACLKSVYGWADEIILVDDESTDKTVEIARRYTDKICQRKMDKYGTQVNWALTKTNNDWNLLLDGHEIVTEELKQEIKENLKISSDSVAFAIPIKNYIGNYWVRYGGWYPANKVRLFRKDKFRYEEVGVHPRVFIDGKCGRLTKDIIHKGYPDIEHFLFSLNRQTTQEAQKWLDTKRKMSLGHIIWRTFDRFFRRYLRKKGYKDGFYGFIVAFFDSLYQILSYLKYCEMKRNQEVR